MLEKTILIELHHAQDTLTFIDNEEVLDPLVILLSENIFPVPFRILLEIDSVLELT